MRRLTLCLVLAACAGSSEAVVGQPQSDGGTVTSAVKTCPEGSFADGHACDSFEPHTCTVPDVPDAGSAELQLDVPYAPGVALDVAKPPGASNAPVVLFVHGGAWSGGDKKDHRNDILRLASLGWIGVSVNYRLVDHGKNLFPAGISDVRCAARWVHAHASELGAKDRLVAVGVSAGGELVELLGTEPDESALDDGHCALGGTPGVDAVVSYYGRSDLAMPPVLDYVRDYIGRAGDWQSRVQLASPLDHVDAQTKPMLLVHGQQDLRVPIAQSRVLRDALREAHVPVGLVEIPGEVHGFPVLGTKGNDALGACATLAFLHHFR